MAIEGVSEGTADVSIEEIFGQGSAGLATSSTMDDAEAADSANFPDNDAALILSDDAEAEVEADCGSSLTGTAGALELSAVVGEAFTKYIVGFGRNPFGRFSLTAAWNEQTGEWIYMSHPLP